RPTIGGVRDVEQTRRQFWRAYAQERREALMPFLWGVVCKEGQIFGDPSVNSIAKVTNGRNFSYPGYSELLCGIADNRIDSNDRFPNPNVNVLEFLNNRPSHAGGVAAFATWELMPWILNVERSKLPVVAGWTPMQDGPLAEGVNALQAQL